jgi:hypothetical protein
MLTAWNGSVAGRAGALYWGRLRGASRLSLGSTRDSHSLMIDGIETLGGRQILSSEDIT